MIPLGVLASGVAASGEWSPANLPGLDLWLDGDDLAGVAVGDPIPFWPDRSGNGYHAVQTTPDAQPLRTAHGAFFDRGRTLLTGAPASNPARSIIAVARSATSGVGRSIVHTEGSNSFILAMTTLWRMQARLLGSSAGTATSPQNLWSANVWAVIGARVLWDAIPDDETSAIFKDGSMMDSSSGQPTAALSPGRTVHISNGSWDGEISDVICTSSRLSDEDMTRVQAYLMQKRGIT